MLRVGKRLPPSAEERESTSYTERFMTYSQSRALSVPYCPANSVTELAHQQFIFLRFSFRPRCDSSTRFT